MRFEVLDLGFVRYAEGWRCQLRLQAEIAAGLRAPTLVLCEHPRTLTLGRTADRTHVLRDDAWLRRHRFDVHAVERGGDVTYHGPGQLVGYPLFPVGRRVRSFLETLGEAIVEVAQSYGLPARFELDPAGVWIANDKLCAFGVAVRDRVAFHGFALNVATALDDFSAIVPCGLHGRGVTSLSAAVGEVVAVADARDRTVDALHRTFASWDAGATGRPEAACLA